MPRDPLRRWTAALVLAGLCLAAGGRAEEPGTAEARSAPVVMEAFKVDQSYVPRLSFGLSLEVWKDNNTGSVIAIEIGAVREGSDAAEQGLGPRVKVDRIDGKPVREFVASFRPGTELHRIFVGRNNGAKVRLEVRVPGEGRPREVTVQERRDLGISLPSMLERVAR